MTSTGIGNIGKQQTAALALMIIAVVPLSSVRAQAGQGSFGTPPPMQALQKSHWVVEGDSHSRHVIYVFDDPNCPYCHKLWLDLRSYSHTGLPVRNVLVGLIAASSPGNPAAIFDARHPELAWRENETRWGTRSDGGGGIAPLEHISLRDKRAITNNERLMREFGIPGTPGLVHDDARGRAASTPSVWAGTSRHRGIRVGVRYETAINFIGGLKQVAITADFPVRVQWQPFAGTRSTYYVELAVGAFLDGSPDARPFLEVGPTVRFSGGRGQGWFVGFGVAPTLIGGSDFRNHHALGGSFFFTTHIAAGWKSRRWLIGIRFQHTSNAHFDNPNPGVNMLGLVLEYAL